MHISEGVLSAPVLLAGASMAAAGTAIGLKKLDYDRIPQAGLLAAAFFTASLIHVPLGPASAHLTLNGLLGLLLGWSAFPVILIGLVLQAVLFQYGGLTTLGVNTACMALPAVVCYLFFGPLARSGGRRRVLLAGFMTGAVSTLLSGMAAAGALILTGIAFEAAAWTLLAAHLGVMLVEGLVTAGCVMFIMKVKPEMLNGIK